MSTIGRRQVLAGMVAAPIAVAAGSRLSVAAPTGKLTISILDFLEVSLKPVFAAYETARPGSKIEYSILPSTGPELRQALLSRRMANKLPDITYLADIFATQFAEAGILADMRGFLNSGGPITAASFAKPFLDQYLIVSGPKKDGIYGLPQGADTVVLFYNKKHFDDAKLPYPDDSWDFDKQVEVATKLTQKNGGQTTRYGLGVSVPWHATYVPGITALGDSLLDDKGLFKLTSDAAVKLFTMYWDQVKNGVFASNTQFAQLGQIQGAFGSGAASMIQSVRALVPLIKQTVKDDWDVALEPKINGSRHTGMGSIALATTPQGEANNKDLAYDFLTWFYAEDGGMKVLTSTYAVVPPVTALFNSPIWTTLPPPPANVKVFADSIAFGNMNPTSIPADVQSVVDSELLKAEQQVTINGGAVADALKTAQATINDAMSRTLASNG
ncbi:MAG: extracellular solute-binding protein [Devosia sp.]|nr:extracellular solute-binding protein [Devosia sp.]